MLISIGKAARLIGVSISTLRRWDADRSLKAQTRTPGGHRRYQMEELQRIFLNEHDDRINLLEGKIATLVLTYQDRLLRFGSNLIFSICEFMGTEVKVLNDKPDQSFEEELSSDVITIMTVACARLYGKRSHQSRKRLAP